MPIHSGGNAAPNLKHLTFVFGLLCMSTTPCADAEDSPADLHALSWLAGTWQGEAFGGVVEEYWDRPWDGAMIGTFRLSVDGKPSLYEFMSITPDSTGLTLRVKHYNPDLTGWEDKDSSVVFRCVGMGEREVRFDGLTYTLLGADSLRIVVNLGHSEGESREVVIDCRRAVCAPDSESR